jgi:hypothetical protein
MKRILFFIVIAFIVAAGSCKKDVSPASSSLPSNLPRSSVPAELRANWMYGNFSMTDYWSQNPANYLGNALEYAIAFTFDDKGEYSQYFTSSSITGGIRTYQQSVTRGTVEIDPANRVIKTHPYTAHYKRTRNGQTEEERDLRPEEISAGATYSYVTGVEPNGSRALHLTLQGTPNALTFYEK